MEKVASCYQLYFLLNSVFYLPLVRPGDFGNCQNAPKNCKVNIGKIEK